MKFSRWPLLVRDQIRVTTWDLGVPNILANPTFEAPESQKNEGFKVFKALNIS